MEEAAGCVRQPLFNEWRAVDYGWFSSAGRLSAYVTLECAQIRRDIVHAAGSIQEDPALPVAKFQIRAADTGGAEDVTVLTPFERVERTQEDHV